MKIWGINWRVFGRMGAVLGFELQAFCTEIEKQAVIDPGGGEIINQLNRMLDGQSFHSLKFDD